MIATPNRRPLVFLIVFVVVSIGGLIYDFSRPAEYRAGARLEIIPAEMPVSDAAGPALAKQAAFLDEVQLLTSHATLSEVVSRIEHAGLAPLLNAPDSIAALQKMIVVDPIQGSQTVQLWAYANRPEITAFALNELMAAYRRQIGARFIDSSRDDLEQARHEVAKYEAAVLRKRSEAEAFRIRYEIASQERDENQTIARTKGLNNALVVAEEKALTAQTRLRALKAAIAEGKAVTRARDNPVIASLQQDLAKARQDLTELERRYTANYLAREPEVKALRTRIPELEAQINRQQQASQQANLAEAEQEAAQTQEALSRLRSQLVSDKQAVSIFSARYAEYKALQDELKNLETLKDKAAERRLKIEAQQGTRAPRVRVIDLARTPSEPWRPNYARDAGITLLGSLILGWLAAWLADFLSRREAGPTVIVAQAQIPYSVGVSELAHAAPGKLLGTTSTAMNLPAPEPAVRELGDAELAALLDVADDESRLALVALLSGISSEELIELSWADVNAQARIVRIPRPAPRELPMAPELVSLLVSMRERKCAEAGARLLSDPSGNPASLAQLDSLIAYAAHDAGLEQPSEITPGVIRHTFIAFLVRQGLRFRELARIVGPLPATVTAMYGAMISGGPRRSLEEIDKVIPALRNCVRSLGEDSRHIRSSG